MSEGTVQPSTLIFTNDSGENFWSVKGEMEDIGQQNAANETSSSWT